MTRPVLILGSTSRYRRELLARLQLPFEVVAPHVDESATLGEAPEATALRLALAKARAVSALHPQAVVIGSDQVCELDGQAIGKPGTHERARAQLQRLSGRVAVFHTAVAVVRLHTGFEEVQMAPVRVHFRALGDAEIERYLRLEEPYDCAGSAKCETLGLPLIRTAELLRRAGIDPLQP
jgi:septum formation protein